MIVELNPNQYRHTPWKNGGGTSIDIAEEDDIWRFGRTPIVASGLFSDYTGFDRMQVLVAGRGLVLKTSEGEIDVRTPFQPVRFAGETSIVSQLEAGSVEVVNLIGARAAVRLGLVVLSAGGTLSLAEGVHIVYAADGPATLTAEGALRALAPDHALRIEPEGSTILACTAGRVIVASIT